MGGGSKGDSQTTEVKLPKELERFANRNLENAEAAARIGYVPYAGPTEAAINPTLMAGMNGTNDMLSAFGMRTADPAASLPVAKDYGGGIQGYDPMALYLQALGKIDPAQRAAIESFTNPQGARARYGNGGGGNDRRTPAPVQRSTWDYSRNRPRTRNTGNPYWDGSD